MDVREWVQHGGRQELRRRVSEARRAQQARLDELRGQVWPNCSQCGTEPDNWTIGCWACAERHHGRRERGSASYSPTLERERADDLMTLRYAYHGEAVGARAYLVEWLASPEVAARPRRARKREATKRYWQARHAGAR